VNATLKVGLEDAFQVLMPEMKEKLIEQGMSEEEQETSITELYREMQAELVIRFNGRLQFKKRERNVP
jgi:hypothetical protein